MEMVPKHFMGRVQNTFFFIGTLLQLVTSILVGAIAEHISLALAFSIIGVMYGIAAITAAWPVAAPAKVPESATSAGSNRPDQVEFAWKISGEGSLSCFYYTAPALVKTDCCKL